MNPSIYDYYLPDAGYGQELKFTTAIPFLVIKPLCIHKASSNNTCLSLLVDIDTDGPTTLDIFRVRSYHDFQQYCSKEEAEIIARTYDYFGCDDEMHYFIRLVSDKNT